MKRHSQLILLSILLSILLLTVTALLAQTPSTRTNEDYDVIKTDTNLVTLNVSVTRKNHPITDLAVRDFQISDAGVVVTPQFFQAQGPASIVFVIDTSTSMRGVKWNNLGWGLKEFLNKQRSDTEYSLIIFNDRASVASQALDAKQLWKEFSRIRPDGETALYDGLALGLDQINCVARHHKAVVLLSDGEDNKSSYDLAAIQRRVFQTHTTIYAVGILLNPKDGPSTQWRDRELLENLATQTGGLSFFPHPDAIEKVLTDISREISSQYSFGYYASGLATGWRGVDVQLLNQPKPAELRYPTRYLLK
jgi:VWFA-related protein